MPNTVQLVDNAGQVLYPITDSTCIINRSGSSTDRPATGIAAGFQYFDTTLGKPVWYDGNSGWVDATGMSV